MQELRELYREVIRPLLPEKVVFVSDMDTAIRLRDHLLLSYLLSAKDEIVLSKPVDFEKKLKSLEQERMLFAKDDELISTDFVVFDLEASSGSLPEFRTLGEASGMLDFLYSSIDSKGEFLCDEPSCKNKKITTEDIITALVEEPEDENIVYFIVEEYESENTTVTRTDQTLLWKMREEKQRGVRRFFLNELYYTSDDQRDETSLLKGVGRLGVVRRSVFSGADIKKRLLEEVSSHVHSIDKNSQLWIYRCTLLSSKSVTLNARRALDSVYECSLCKRSFMPHKDKGAAFEKTLRLISDASSDSLSVRCMPEKRYGHLLYSDCLSSLSTITKKLPEVIPKDLNKNLEGLFLAGLDSVPLSEKLSEMDEVHAYLFLLYIFQEKSLDRHLFFLPVDWVEEEQEKIFWKLIASIRRQGASFVFYGGSAEFRKRALKRKYCAEVVRGGGAGEKVRIEGKTGISGKIGISENPRTLAEILGIRNVIASLFGSTMEARVQGLSGDDFFSNESLLCLSCMGKGYYTHALPLGYSCCSVCADCEGTQVSEKSDLYRYMGYSLREFLSGSSAEVLDEFRGVGELGRALEVLRDAGLTHYSLSSRVFELSFTEKMALLSVVSEGAVREGM